MNVLSKKHATGEETGKHALAGNQRLYALVAMILIYALFAIFGRNFLSFETAVNILDASYYIGRRGEPNLHIFDDWAINASTSSIPLIKRSAFAVLLRRYLVSSNDSYRSSGSMTTEERLFLRTTNGS